MSKVNYIKCDICGKPVGKDSIHDRIFRFFAGVINRRPIDICDTCLYNIDKVSEDLKTEEELYSYALNTGEHAKEFKDDSDLYSAYLAGVEDAAGYLSQHQIERARYEW